MVLADPRLLPRHRCFLVPLPCVGHRSIPATFPGTWRIFACFSSSPSARSAGHRVEPRGGPRALRFLVAPAPDLRTMWSFGWCLTERYERLTTDRPFRVELEAMEHWDEVARPGRASSWSRRTWGSSRSARCFPRPGSTRSPGARARGRRAGAGIHPESVIAGSQAHFTMHFQSDDPLQGMVLLDALWRGEIVAVQGDRPRAGGRRCRHAVRRPSPLPPGRLRSPGPPVRRSSQSSSSVRAAGDTGSSSARRSALREPTIAPPI